MKREFWQWLALAALALGIIAAGMAANYPKSGANEKGEKHDSK